MKIFLKEKCVDKRSLLCLFSIFLVSILIVSSVSSVNAADITIGPNTSGGLKKAVEIAGDGDTIYMRNGVYTCEDNRGIVINKSVTIEGLGKNVVIDAQGKDRILTLAYWIEKDVSSFPKYSVTLKNLTMINGKTKGYGGAIYVDTAQNDSYYEHITIAFKQNKLSVIECTFINNNAKGGGAIISSDTTVINSTFINNSAKNLGGALYSNYDWLYAKFSGNIPFSFIVRDSTFINNKASAGGAITAWCDNFTLKNCIFTNNTASAYGGAISGDDRGDTISNSIFTNNKAGENGGAISKVTNVINCTFTNNIAKNGGAISYVATVINCTFKSNTAKESGSDFYRVPNVKNCTFLKDVTISPKDDTHLMPDLTISKIAKGANTHVIFIKNVGLVNSKKSVLGVYDGKKLIKKANVKAIGKGKTVFVIVTLAKKFKNKIKTFKADYNNKIKESNEKNNIRKAK